MNKRQVLFLTMLLANHGRWLPIDYFAEELEVSAKTLRRDIAVLEEFLKSFEGRIGKKSGVGIKLIIPRNAIGKLKNQVTYLAHSGQNQAPQGWEKEHRRLAIALNLLLYSDEYTSLSSLAYQYYTSKSTINQDLQELEVMLEPFSITVKKDRRGTIIIGLEEQVRRALVSVIAQILDSGSGSQKDILAAFDARSTILDIFKEGDITFVNQLIGGIEIRYHYRFEEREFIQLSLGLLVMIYRVKNGFFIAGQPKAELAVTGTAGRIAGLADELSKQLEDYYRLPLPEQETRGIAAVLLTTRLFLTANYEDSSDDLFQLFCEDFIDAFSTITNINLRENPVFCENVIAHINLMLNRLFHGIPASNPLMDLLLKDYQSTLNVCRIICTILARKFQLPELSLDEISFLMIYIQGEIVRQSEHARVLLVTDQTKSIANLIKIRLRQRFPQWQIETGTIDDFEQITKADYDFCLSTVLMEAGPERVPYGYITPILDDNDIQNIQQLCWETDESAAGYRLELIRIVHDLHDIGCRVEFATKLPPKNPAEWITIVALKGIRYRYSLNYNHENCCVFVLDQQRILEVQIKMCSFDFMLFTSKIVYLLDNCPEAVIPEFISFFTS